MCIHWDKVYQMCGHRAFHSFEFCADFPERCLGNNGAHTDWPLAELCYDCKSRQSDPNPSARDHDPYILASQQSQQQEQLTAQQYQQQQQLSAQQHAADLERQRQEAEAAMRKRILDKLEAGKLQQQQWKQYQMQQQQQQQLAQMIAEGQGSFQRVPGQGVQWIPAQPIQALSQGQVQWPQGQPQAQEQGTGKSKGKGKGKGKAKA